MAWPWHCGAELSKVARRAVEWSRAEQQSQFCPCENQENGLRFSFISRFFLGVSHILILGGLLFVTILRKSRLRLDFPLPLEDSSSSSSSLLLSLLLPPSSHPLPSFFPPSSFFSLLLTLPFFPSPSSSLAAFCFA